jgi:alpha-beta hydrolase superfamily lysophospholipase
VQDVPALVDALILSSPMFGLQPRHRPVGPKLARAAALLAPRLPLPNGIEDRELTRDPKVLSGFERDALRHHRTTPRWYWATLREIERAHERAAAVALAVLVIAAERDSIANPSAIERLSAMFASEDKQFVVRANALHEVLNELDRDELYRFVLEWIRERFGPR